MANDYIPPYKSDGTPNVRASKVSAVGTSQARAKFPCEYCGYLKASPEPYTCPGCGRRPNEPTQKREEGQYISSSGGGGDIGDAFKGLCTFIAIVLFIIMGVAFPPLGVPLGLVATIRLFAYLGKK